MSAVDLDNSSPAQIYAAITEMDQDEFERLVGEAEPRAKLISAMAEHMVALFDAEAAGELEARIQIKLWDHPDGGYDHFELAIAGGTCELAEELGDDPDLTLKIRPTDLRKLLAGETGPKRLALKRRLTALGDIGLGMRLQELFRF